MADTTTDLAAASLLMLKRASSHSPPPMERCHKLSIDFLLNSRPSRSSSKRKDPPSPPPSTRVDGPMEPMYSNTPSDESIDPSLSGELTPCMVNPVSPTPDLPLSPTFCKRRRLSPPASPPPSVPSMDHQPHDANATLPTTTTTPSPPPSSVQHNLPLDSPDSPAKTPNLFDRIRSLPETPLPCSLDTLLRANIDDIITANNDNNNIVRDNNLPTTSQPQRQQQQQQLQQGAVALEASFPSKKGLAPLKTRKRPTSYQRAFLEYVFRLEPWPDTASKLLISQKIQMTPQQINTWFQVREKKNTQK